MSARRAPLPFSGRPHARDLARGAAVALVVLTGAAARAEQAAPGPVGGPTAVATAGAHRGSPTRPDYDCSKGGFCGTEGWDYGSYAGDTKESVGCGLAPDGVDLWDLSASHSPTLPDFARAHCAFFYGFATCSLPTVICEN